MGQGVECLMDQVVKRHRMQRLRGLTGRGVIRDRLQLVVGGEACVGVDVPGTSRGNCGVCDGKEGGGA